MLANRNLLGLGVTGDGDTASIGIGQFMHLVRRNLPMIYVIEDNGVYGLTKGQFSATADLGSKLKTGAPNDLPPFDCCALALKWGATFVARSFSGDKKQLQAILKTAIAHNGLSVIDVVSPCVTFNDHEGSTKSYSYMKEHESRAARAGFRAVLRGDRGRDSRRRGAWTCRCTTARTCASASSTAITIPTNRLAALTCLEEAEAKDEVLTGVLYVNTAKPTFLELLNMADEPLATLPESKTRPPKEVLDEVMEELR